MKKVKFISLAFMQQIETPANVISIGDRGEAYVFACEHKNMMRVEFDDIEGYVGPEYHNFDCTHARKILDFVKHLGDEDILVHCHAGVSRSAAVAKFLCDHLGYTLDVTHPGGDDLSCHNTEVYRTLFVIWTDRKMVKKQIELAAVQKVDEDAI